MLAMASTRVRLVGAADLNEVVAVQLRDPTLIMMIMIISDSDYEPAGVTTIRIRAVYGSGRCTDQGGVWVRAVYGSGRCTDQGGVCYHEAGYGE